MNTKEVCPECGSENVGIEATADFNPNTQQWEFTDGYYDHGFCRDCDFEGETLTVEFEGTYEHPVYFRTHWKHEVCQDETNLGYWEWVKHKMDAE